MNKTSNEYAIALFGLANETGVEETVLNGLKLASEVFRETPELYGFLKSPGISKETRLKTVQNAFSDDTHEYVVSFICLLCEHGNIELFAQCVEDYENLYSISRKIVHAKVTSVVDLSEKQKITLHEKLVKKLKCEVEIEYKIDPTLLGGVTVEMDGIILDGSLKNRLQTMKEVMDE